MSSLPLQQDLEARLKDVRLLKVYRDMEPARKGLSTCVRKLTSPLRN